MKANFGFEQELAEGRSLAQLMEEGWRADEAEVTRIGIQLLEILEYLGSRRPSVTHRCREQFPLCSNQVVALKARLVPLNSRKFDRR